MIIILIVDSNLFTTIFTKVFKQSFSQLATIKNNSFRLLLYPKSDLIVNLILTINIVEVCLARIHKLETISFISPVVLHDDYPVSEINLKIPLNFFSINYTEVLERKKNVEK
jgi:hypothetical protein